MPHPGRPGGVGRPRAARSAARSAALAGRVPRAAPASPLEPALRMSVLARSTTIQRKGNLPIKHGRFLESNTGASESNTGVSSQAWLPLSMGVSNPRRIATSSSLIVFPTDCSTRCRTRWEGRRHTTARGGVSVRVGAGGAPEPDPTSLGAGGHPSPCCTTSRPRSSPSTSRMARTTRTSARRPTRGQSRCST